MKRYASLASLALASTLFLSLAGCNKSDNSGGNSSGSSSGSSSSGTSSSSGSKSSMVSNRFIGTWMKEGDDPNSTYFMALRLAEDGKVYFTRGPREEQIGTYTEDGNIATINPFDESGELGGTSTATLESNNRIRLESKRSKDTPIYLIRK